MNRVIYSIFVEPEFEGRKEQNNLSAFNDYKQRLLECKQEYAKKCDAEWIFFDKIGYIQEFQQKFSIDTIYNAVNIYKIFMFEELGKKYDEVLYLDFDVIPKTDRNFFEDIDLSKKIWCVDQNDFLSRRDMLRFKNTRSPVQKYELSIRLCGKPNKIINTAIMGGSSSVIKQIAFMDKLPEYIKKTNELMEFEAYFTHNNEAFFSAALIDSGVEPQCDDRTWHTRLDPMTAINHVTREKKDINKLLSESKFLHVINKNFSTYYKDRKSAIYSLHIEIPEELQEPAGAFDGDTIDKNERARINFLKYFDRLEKNKKDYAKLIGAEYILFENDNRYNEFREWLLHICPMSEYNVVNFYKIWCMEELTMKYDNVLYMDFDVVVNTDVSFFDAFTLQNYIACAHDEHARTWVERDIKKEYDPYSGKYVYHYRSPTAKYWNCHALLSYDGHQPQNDVYNTGIFGASRRQMDQLEYFVDFKKTLEKMTEMKEEEFSMYLPMIQKSFGYDNETVMSYKCQTNNVNVKNLDGKYWHNMVDNNAHSKKKVLNEASGLYHVMNKKFEWFHDII
tara:strand:+ start:1072 stop:2760 length:1689 start_codon:yes stop_codon:yes gene_type:complete